MTLEISKRDYYIGLLRKNGFKCFPIPQHQKAADGRYKAEVTPSNQPINTNENFGYLPVRGNGNAIIDIDNKERYRGFAEAMIKEKYMVIESPHGWHLPVIGLSGNVSKVELFDYNFQPDKKIIETQGPKHYCVGPYSEIVDDETGELVTYKNLGSEKIWNARGKDFHEFIEGFCTNLSVTGRQRNSRSSSKNLRERFKKGEPPTKGFSNDYFFEAARVCYADGLTQSQAIEKIRVVYDKWTETSWFSGRPWSNIERKIDDVYDNKIGIETGRPKGSTHSGLDRVGIVEEMINARELYSDVETHEIFENKNGFLEKINNSLKRELGTKYPEIERADYDSILFKLESRANQIPETNKNLIVFKNRVYDRRVRTTIETEELADIGFKDYRYLEPKPENEPKKFIEIIFGNVPEFEHPRIKAGLRSVLWNYLDPRISVIHGLSRVGKSTGLLILVKILGDYAMAVELDQFLNDKFIRAKVRGLRLLVFQDLPQNYKDFTVIKNLTGEQIKTERGFMQDSGSFENKLKIWASGNYLAKIPEKEKNAMYSARLSLIHNTRTEPYPEDPTLMDEIAKEEGEKIISWILNLQDSECQYEVSKTIRKEWEELASPENKYIQEHFEVVDVSEAVDVSVTKILRQFMESTDSIMDIGSMSKALQDQGFVVKFNIVKNLREIVKPKPKPTIGCQQKL